MAPRQEDVAETEPLVRTERDEEGDLEEGGASSPGLGPGDASSSAPEGEADSGSERGVGECRICGDEDAVANLEVPCACSGSVKYAHHKCIQRWCDEKRDTICEMCLTPFRGDYHAGRTEEEAPTQAILFAPRRTADGRIAIEILHDGHPDAEVEDNSPGARFRSVAFIVLGLLLLRHLLFGISGAAASTPSSPSTDGGGGSEALFSVMFLRMLVLMLPFVVMVRLLTAMRRARVVEESHARAEFFDAVLRRQHAAGGLVGDGGAMGRARAARAEV